MRRLVVLAAFSALAALAGATSVPQPSRAESQSEPTPDRPVPYREQIEPVLERRCVVCHACYDAPCQLLLSSGAGIERGASKEAVYKTDRLHDMEPSRLFVDAQSVAQWRDRGFFSVTSGSEKSQSAALLLQMLTLGHEHPFFPGAKLPESVALDINRTLTCPKTEEFAEYAKREPHGGMPYGLAALGESELKLLLEWAADGASVPQEPEALPAPVAAQVAAWESFLNGDSLKERITARYLYEHWFLAHLYFEDQPEGPFFRIVRSRTAPGSPVDEIATRRPYDSPGKKRFWYRLRPLDETIVRKTHIVYPLSAARMRRLTELFLGSDWQPRQLPSYETAEASNPFVSFADVPARARYQYLLDDAQYFVMTFIRGPVCRGQVAVDVIEDRFFVAFIDPDYDPSVTDPAFLEQAKYLLSLPAEHLSLLGGAVFWLEHDREQRRYLDLREQYYDKADPDRRGPSLDFIWDGDGHNRNAQLTVMRHFDNATVLRGFVGEIPKTAWIVDFPILERIYYDLVAGYDVFGNVSHQLATRLYMDHLRMQSENQFLRFLPAERRQEIHASWYVDATHTLDYSRIDRPQGTDHATQIVYTSPDVKTELIGMILARNPAVSGPPDLLNRCGAPPCDRGGASALERRAERALRPLAGVRGAWVAPLPDLTFLRVHDSKPGGEAAAYSLVHDRAHANVAFLFGEDQRLVPQDDTVAVVPGYTGSYPNFVFDVDVADVERFTRALIRVKNASDLETLVEHWGVRRTSPNFWSTIDWLHADYRRLEPTEFGLFDLNRYKNL